MQPIIEEPSKSDSAAASYQSWVSEGSQLTVEAGGQKRQVFVRQSGSGPAVTLIHGFPSSSWDWQGVEQLLKPNNTVIALDLLGYGESEKPWPHRYSVDEHADVIVAVWQALGVDSTVLVGHDVGSSVAQELLARYVDGTLGVRLESAVFLNGALFTDHYQPARVTKLLANPILGRLVAGAMNESRLGESMSALFSDQGRPAPDHFVQQWANLTKNQGQRVIPGLTHYLADKRQHQDRWKGATINTDLPVGVVWGALDTALPEVLYNDAVRYLPKAHARLLKQVGHFPQVERPDVVVEVIRDAKS
jgi:pimeloyl-ACP methyl ester carboxylesterase